MYISHSFVFRYTGHKFVSTLIYSVLLGFLGMDRFCLGHTGNIIGILIGVSNAWQLTACIDSFQSLWVEICWSVLGYGAFMRSSKFSQR